MKRAIDYLKRRADFALESSKRQKKKGCEMCSSNQFAIHVALMHTMNALKQEEARSPQQNFEHLDIEEPIALDGVYTVSGEELEAYVHLRVKEAGFAQEEL